MSGTGGGDVTLLGGGGRDVGWLPGSAHRDIELGVPAKTRSLQEYGGWERDVSEAGRESTSGSEGCVCVVWCVCVCVCVCVSMPL